MQHSLLTEIRELVFPEDRSRFDELVYRRDPYRDNGERLRVSNNKVNLCMHFIC